MSWTRSYARATRGRQRPAANGAIRADNGLAAAAPPVHDDGMRQLHPFLFAAGLALALGVPCAVGAQAAAGRYGEPAANPAAVAAATMAINAPSYVDDKLKFPEHYREWIYLTSGLDMSYSASAKRDHHMFDNVFVNPEAYQSFMQTGTWPDKTTILIELRGGQSKGSINKAGLYQDEDVMGYELHVKDEARFPGKWAFFSFDDTAMPATMIAHDVDCYSCHEKHGAVDTSFVQFYPTLRSIAKAKGTLAASYLAEEAASAPH